MRASVSYITEDPGLANLGYHGVFRKFMGRHMAGNLFFFLFTRSLYFFTPRESL